MQVFAGKLAHPRALWLLPSAWGFLGIAVCLGAVRLAWIGQARSYRATFEALRGELRRLVVGVARAENPAAEWDKLLAAAVEVAFRRPNRAMKVYGALHVVSFYAFALGVLGLLVFAALNLPF